MISKFLEHTTYNGLRENALHVHAMQMLLMSLLQHLVLRATEALQAKIALHLVAGLVAIVCSAFIQVGGQVFIGCDHLAAFAEP